ncbi:MAG: hypothetical protein ABWJ97_06440 [Thermoproteus sp.]
MEAIEVPGCPNGSLFVASYLLEKRPKSAKFLVPDGDCVAALKFVLPYIGYSLKIVRAERGWLVEAVKT